MCATSPATRPTHLYRSWSTASGTGESGQQPFLRQHSRPLPRAMWRISQHRNSPTSFTYLLAVCSGRCRGQPDLLLPLSELRNLPTQRVAMSSMKTMTPRPGRSPWQPSMLKPQKDSTNWQFLWQESAGPRRLDGRIYIRICTHAVYCCVYSVQLSNYDHYILMYNYYYIPLYKSE